CVYDLGAHHAGVAMMLGHLVGPAGLVVAVEAGAWEATAARRNLALNSVDNVELLNMAIADRSVPQSFSYGQVSMSRSKIGREQVAGITIDDLAAQYRPPAVVYMDIEGYECRALLGAQ